MGEQLRAIWEGYWQFGLSSSSKLFLIVVDVLIVSLVVYLIVSRFNTRRGISYLSTIGLTVIGLILSAYFTLPALHFISQALLVVLLVGLPLFFHETWVELFTRQIVTNRVLPTREQYLGGFALLLVALILAAGLVGLTSGAGVKTGELPQRIAVEAVNLPQGVSANLGSNNSVSVIIAAPRRQWDSLTAESFTATVDLGNQKEGTYDLPVNLNAKIPEVKIVRLKPKRLTVTVEPVITKTVNIVVKFSGKAGDELVPDEPTLNPDKAEVSGAKSVIKDLTQATAALKLNGETKTIEQKLNLVGLTPDGEPISGLTFNPKETTATVSLIKAGKLKTVGIRPILTGQPSSGYWVKTAAAVPGTVTITGSADTLEATNEILTDPISIVGLGSNQSLEAKLVLPSGISLAEKVEKVTVKLELAESLAAKSITPEIIYDSLAPALKVSAISPVSLTASISGASNALAAMLGSEVKVKLDLSAYKSAGTYAVAITNVSFLLPEKIGLVSFLPSAIDVTLENR